MLNKAESGNPNAQEHGTECTCMQLTATMMSATRPLAYSVFVRNATAGMTTNIA